MEDLIRLFSPQPTASERPSVLNVPTRENDAHPLAWRAANALMESLSRGELAPRLSSQVLYGSEGGKMFGVLVVELPDGRVGNLKAFSGQLQGSWDVPGYVPPVFDRKAREALEPTDEASVRSLTARVVAARALPEWAAMREGHLRLLARQSAEEWALKECHAARRAARRVERADKGDVARANIESRADEVEHRTFKTRLRQEREEAARALLPFERRLRALERLRRWVSRAASFRLYGTYVFENGLGQRTPLEELFAPAAPPSGTGDCAAPKLLIFARRNGLKPLALAEFWWGLPARGGGRRQGQLFPPCPGKCGVVLPFLLRGVNWTSTTVHERPQLQDRVPVPGRRGDPELLPAENDREL